MDDADNKHKLSSKLQRRYSGPHTILSGVNPVTYKAIVNGKVRTMNAHNMKRDLPAPKTLHEIPDFHEDDDPIDLEEKDQKEEKEIDIEPDLLEQNENVEEDDNPIDDYPDEKKTLRTKMKIQNTTTVGPAGFRKNQKKQARGDTLSLKLLPVFK